MKAVIKNYFEETIKTDSALAEVYDEKKLDKCIAYVTSQAKKHLNNKSGAIEDTIVFKWARDYMYGDTADQTDKEAEDYDNNLEQKVTEEYCTNEAGADYYKPATKKAKKQKKEEPEEEYDGPYLFDFLEDGE